MINRKDVEVLAFWAMSFIAGYCFGGKEGVGYAAAFSAGTYLFVVIFGDD